MTKQPGRKGAKAKSGKIRDLPLEADKKKQADARILGGGRKGTSEPAPSSSVSINFVKTNVEY